jgi:hypothetical protein
MRVPSHQAGKILEAYKKLILGKKNGAGLADSFGTSLVTGKRKTLLEKAVKGMSARLAKMPTPPDPSSGLEVERDINVCTVCEMKIAFNSIDETDQKKPCTVALNSNGRWFPEEDEDALT